MVRAWWLILIVVLFFPLESGAWVGFDGESDSLYGWSDTNHPSDSDAPTYSWTSIATTGTELSFATGDHGPIDIGFEFDFYDGTYSQVYISQYGIVGFDSVSSASSPASIPNVSSPNNFIAGLWSYYDSSRSTAYYELVGEPGSQQFIVEFSMITDGWRLDEEYNFQVVLEEASGNIFVNVQESASSWWGMGSYVGIENDDGSRGIMSHSGSSMLSEYSAVFAFIYRDHPSIRILSDDPSVDEGGSVEIEIRVTDRQEDAGEPHWDLDEDGEFDDAQGTSVTLDASDADGPSELTPSVRVVDDAGNERIVAIPVAVRNLPPQFGNTNPVTEVIRQQEWEFSADLTDPAPGDVITMIAEQRPAGMTVLANGGLRWTPTADDVGAHLIRLVATDDDDDPDVEGDGDAVLEFTLTVLNNTAPGIPTIIQPEDDEVVTETNPTFIVQTPEDPEGDILTIQYDIDTNDAFNSPDRISGSIQASIGQTGWTLSDELEDMTRYWFRVNATDGIDSGLYDVISFTTDFSGGDGDSDGDSDGDGDGDAEVDACACRAGGPRTALGPLTMVLFLSVVLAILRRNWL